MQVERLLSSRIRIQYVTKHIIQACIYQLLQFTENGNFSPSYLCPNRIPIHSNASIAALLRSHTHRILPPSALGVR